MRELLARTELRQLAQRMTGRYHLNPLSREETRAYVRHRLRVAGASAEIFNAGALNEVHRLSSGIPRVINVCCDRALLGAYTRETRKVTAGLVRRAAGEVYGRRFAAAWIGRLAIAVAAVGIAGLTYSAWQLWATQRAAPRATGRDRARRTAPTPSTTPSTTPSAAAAATPVAASTTGAPQAQSISAELAALTPAADADAYRRLFALWGAKPANDADPCAYAVSSGLACLAQRGSWAQVRMLDRPAILSLSDDQGRDACRAVDGAHRPRGDARDRREDAADAARGSRAKLVRRVHGRMEAESPAAAAIVERHERARRALAPPQPRRAARRRRRPGARGRLRR